MFFYDFHKKCRTSSHTHTESSFVVQQIKTDSFFLQNYLPCWGWSEDVIEQLLIFRNRDLEIPNGNIQQFNEPMANKNLLKATKAIS